MESSVYNYKKLNMETTQQAQYKLHWQFRKKNLSVLHLGYA